MDLSPYQPWIVFTHVAAAFAFIAAHGASMGVFFKIRRERDRAKLVTLLELSSYSIGVLYIAFLVLLVAGTLAGIVGGWWTNGRLWLWAALVVLVVVVGAMYGLMTTTYVKLRTALGIPSPSETKKGIVPAPGSDAEVDALLTSSRPTIGAVIGIAGLLVIVWLMVVKPF
jgi:hypothetical protein